MIKITLLSALTALFMLPAIASAESITISESGYFDATTNATWVAVTALTLKAEGAASQGEQTLVMNVTSLPEGGANYRVYKTLASGGDYFADAQALSLGVNTITVAAVSFDRAVKVQFDSDAVEFDALTVNDETLWPLDSSGGISIAGSGMFNTTTNTTWVRVLATTTAAEGADSQNAQTVEIYVTSLPEGGANYRVNKTTDNGNWNQGSAKALNLGANTITVNAVAFDRSVSIQFDSEAVEFNSLTVNGEALWPIETSGNKTTIANSNLFNTGPDAEWVAAITTTVPQDGATSHNAQSVEIFVTSLPTGGANWRLRRTTVNGYNDYRPSTTGTALGYGANVISVNAVAFDRTVQVQFTSNEVEYNALSVNGVARVIGATVAEAPSVNIDGSAISWTETDGTTLQYSEDLESWTSLPSATSPYTPATTPDRFYRTINDD